MLADRLGSLVVRLHQELGPAAHVRRWDGAWDALESPGSVMLQTDRPNVLVSLLSIALADAGRSPNVSRALRSSPAAEPYQDSNPMIHAFPAGAGPRFCNDLPAAAGDVDPDVQWPSPAEALPIAAPVVSAEVAVTLLTTDPSRCGRSDAALQLLPRLLPTLIDYGVTAVEGTNLYGEALAAKRFAGFSIAGRVEVSLDDNLRRRCAQALRDRRLTLKQAATDIGDVTASELSTWLQWDRDGDYDRLDRLVLNWLAFTPAAVDLVDECSDERFQVLPVSE